MSDDRGDCEGWTLSTLYTHLTGRIHELGQRNVLQFEAQEKAVELAMGAAEKAVEKANTANEKRFDNVNEFRGTLSDQNKMFVTRAELFGYMAALAAVITLVVSILYYFGQNRMTH